jgi:hypothetical protein
MVWVWGVDKSDQVESWVEDFAESTQVLRVAAPTITSTADATIALSDFASDEVSVSGPQMGASSFLTWAAYRQSAGASSTCDVSNQVFSSATDPLKVSEPGNYAVPVPPQFLWPGKYVWVATLSALDGSVIARGQCDDTSEVTDVVTFSLSTAAVSIVTDGSSATDTAIIKGPVPSGATLDFAIYKQASDAPECLGTNLVWRSHPVGIVGEGTVESDAVVVATGRYFWVATAYDRNGSVLQTGVCGDPSEVTTAIGALAFTGSVPQVGVGWLAGGALVIVYVLLCSRTRRTRDRGARPIAGD